MLPGGEMLYNEAMLKKVVVCLLAAVLLTVDLLIHTDIANPNTVNTPASLPPCS